MSQTEANTLLNKWIWNCRVTFRDLIYFIFKIFFLSPTPTGDLKKDKSESELER